MNKKLEKIARLVKELQDEEAAAKNTPQPVPPTTDYIPLSDAAEMLKVSKTQIMRLNMEGKLKVYRLSRRKLYISKSELEAAITNNHH